MPLFFILMTDRSTRLGNSAGGTSTLDPVLKNLINLLFLTT